MYLHKNYLFIYYINISIIDSVNLINTGSIKPINIL